MISMDVSYRALGKTLSCISKGRFSRKQWAVDILRRFLEDWGHELKIDVIYRSDTSGSVTLPVRAV